MPIALERERAELSSVLLVVQMQLNPAVVAR
jgi:hypothetical protein